MAEQNPQNQQNPQLLYVDETETPQEKKEREELEKQFQALNENQKLALKCRLEGWDYHMIADELAKTGFNNTELTLRGWFTYDQPLGILYHTICNKRAIESQRSLDNARKILNGAATKAAKIIDKALEQGLRSGTVDPEQYITARDLLDRTGFPKQSKTDFSGNIESNSMDQVANGIKAIAESLKPAAAKQNAKP